MATLIEQEAPAHTHETPKQTPAAITQAHGEALVKSLETLLARLGYLERQAILLAVEADVKRDHAWRPNS